MKVDCCGFCQMQIDHVTCDTIYGEGWHPILTDINIVALRAKGFRAVWTTN